MSTAPQTDTLDRPAVEPSRVLILDAREQAQILDALEANDYLGHAVARRIAYGDEYADETDELARVTLRKRRLEAEIKRCNRAIDRLTEPVVDKLTDIGARSITHAATGTRIQRDDQVYLAYADPGWSRDEQAYARMRAGETMATLGGEWAAFITPTYNAQTIGAHLRERYKARIAAELDKPEHERQPVDPGSVIPDELREWLTLSVTPRVKVTAT